MVEDLGTPIRGRRVVFVLGGLGLGGAERQAIYLARHLKKIGWDVQVWGLGSSGPAARLCEEYGMPWRALGMSWHPRVRVPTPGPLAVTVRPALVWGMRIGGLLNLAFALRRVSPDVLLSYTMPANVACGLVSGLAGNRFWVWNQRDEGLQRLGQRLERRAASRCNLFVANSAGGAGFLRNAIGVSSHLTHVVRNGIALAEPQSNRVSWRDRLSLDDDTIAVCMVGNVHGNKDHITLLRAWRRVLDQALLGNIKVVLVLAGRLDVDEPMKYLCTELGLEGDVRFPGMVEDIPGLLAAMDIGVHSSISEGCSNAVVEYMASGLSVAGTDIPGISEVVGAENARFLAPPGDPAALAECLLRLILDRGQRMMVGQANRRRAGSEFSLDRMCEKMTAAIERAIAETSSKGRQRAHLT